MSTTASQAVVQRLWNYCNLLRDVGLSYGDYLEQLTYLLFLKMASMSARGVKYCPAPLLVSSAFFSSSPS